MRPLLIHTALLLAQPADDDERSGTSTSPPQGQFDHDLRQAYRPPEGCKSNPGFDFRPNSTGREGTHLPAGAYCQRQ